MTQFSSIPLAERMRPKSLEAFQGQEKLISDQGIITKFLQKKTCPSIIFWGSPGVGKTTLSFLIAKELGMPFYSLSAISSGIKEVRESILKYDTEGTILLFIDEIHRFNKTQQDSLLKAVEEGKIILIGATTENPSFEVNKALLSRCKVFVLEDLTKDSLMAIAKHAIENDHILQTKKIEVVDWDALLKYSSGDARKLLNLIELTINMSSEENILITNEVIVRTLQQNIALYDKNGEMHYDIISAFIKSMRGSDPNAAIYWLCRMIDGGEDPKFIARRMIIFASEDIGISNPNALLLANTCFDSVAKIGYPECSIILSQVVVYLATSVKSNSTYMALKHGQKAVQMYGALPVPLHLRNAPTQLMKDLNYSKDYQYAHHFEGNFVDLAYLPSDIQGETFYHPSSNAKENEILAHLKKWWPTKYK